MAELKEIVNEIRPIKDDSLKKILNNLLDGSTDLDLKTHIFKPKQLSALISFANYLKTRELKNSAKLIIDFVKDYLRKMVSYKRLSRTEIIKAFQSINEREIQEKQKSNNLDI